MLEVAQDSVKLDLNKVAEIVKTKDTQPTVISIASLIDFSFYNKTFNNLVEGNLEADLTGNKVSLNLDFRLQKFFAEQIDGSWLTLNVDFLSAYTLEVDQELQAVTVVQDDNRSFFPASFIIQYYTTKSVKIGDGKIKTNKEYKLDDLENNELITAISCQSELLRADGVNNHDMVQKYFDHPKAAKCVLWALEEIKKRQG